MVMHVHECNFLMLLLRKRSQKRDSYSVSATGPQDWTQEPTVLENPQMHFDYKENTVSSRSGVHVTYANQNVYIIENGNGRDGSLNGFSDNHQNGSSNTKF